MKNTRIFYFLLVVLILFANVHCQDTEPSSGASMSKKLEKILTDLSSSGGAQILSSDNKGGSTNINIPSEAPPMNITRKIISPRREEGFFLDDVIVVQVTVTSVKKEGLEDVEIWEIPGEGIEVINCSYPIVTSEIGQVLDYEKSDKSFLKETDINVINIIRNFQNGKRSEIRRIKEILPKKTQENLTKINLSHLNESEINSLRSDLKEQFNNIINDKSYLDLNASFFDTSPRVLNDGLDYWINPLDPIENKTFIELEDYRLLKRRLLEYAFQNETTNMPEGIRRLSFDKKHENMLKEPQGPINYPLPNLRDRESIVLKYYLRPTEIGLTDLRSIIRSKDHLHEETTNIKVVPNVPRFDYTYSCETKELSKGKDVTYIFNIKYLGGDKDKEFVVKITSPGSCDIKSVQALDEKKRSLDKGKDNQSISLNFTRGMTRDLAVTVSYKRTGHNLSPPKIAIEKSASDFDEDISVFEKWDLPFTVHTESFTMIAIILTLLISSSFFGKIWKKAKSKTSWTRIRVHIAFDNLVKILMRK